MGASVNIKQTVDDGTVKQVLSVCNEYLELWLMDCDRNFKDNQLIQAGMMADFDPLTSKHATCSHVGQCLLHMFIYNFMRV